MAKPRYQGWRPHRTGARRSLEWEAANVATATTDVGAGVLTNVILVGDGSETKRTVYRIVGSLFLAPQGTFTSHNIIHYGVYKRNQITSGGDATINPSLSADVALDNWLYWNAMYWVAGSVATNANSAALYRLPIDIKVKRTLDVSDNIILGISSALAYTHAVNLRVLMRLT